MAQTILLFIVVLSVTSSTIDSGYSGLQWIAERLSLPKWTANGLGLLTMALFPLLISWGVVQLWFFYGSIRWYVVIGFTAATILYNNRQVLMVDWWVDKFRKNEDEASLKKT